MTTQERTATTGQALLLFDGLCGMCHGTIRFVMRRDPAQRLRYVPLESRLAREILAQAGLSQPDASVKLPDGIVLVEHALTPRQCVTMRSDAAIRTLRLLRGIGPFVGLLLSITPRWLREAAYGLVARCRYTLFGRHEVCPLPSTEERGLILGAGDSTSD